MLCPCDDDDDDDDEDDAGGGGGDDHNLKNRVDCFGPIVDFIQGF